MIKVLLVEDENILAGIIKDSLETRKFTVHCAHNGEEGLRMFHEICPDIVVADVMMPRMDGFAMAGLIRQTDKLTPILFLTSKSATSDVVKGFETGGNDYLKKPFGIEELIVRINALLNRIQIRQQTNTVLQIGAYTFDSTRQVLYHAGTAGQLSHRESEILKRLYEKRNNVLENKTILLELWGDDNFFNTRSLNVFMVKLRKKLNADPSVQIVSIRGVGYKLIFNE
jgi:two-component system, OmpR family, response regulator TrcR